MRFWNDYLGFCYTALKILYRTREKKPRGEGTGEVVDLFPETIDLFRSPEDVKLFFVLYGGKSVRVPSYEEFVESLELAYMVYLRDVEGRSRSEISEKMKITEKELEELERLEKSLGEIVYGFGKEDR